MSGLRAEQCTATAKHNGQRCGRLVVGGGVCIVHGGRAPQVKAARERRIAMAEALAADPRRTPDEVLQDVLHQSDWVMRRARQDADDGSPSTELVEAAERAGRWAKTALDAEVDQRQVRVQEAQAVALGAVIRRILGRLELTTAQAALVSTVVPQELARLSSNGEVTS